ncbi:penicillin-binding transpeptidase domain-containing protein [Pyrinomonas methylaliphatogenes]|uniref:Cell division protein FtsI/penicillin-binding protein 2 n=1 Tax=Pyrinomonas methylaliphatogenes TaxID=454194 RepID=A0A0B6X0T5_9BACT|nr:penicillin-binding transpeptidase domain-containing protein [Pyrinomonas methylaliphatogenes]CDM67138.1 cell division protein FtsI/penicillin-binding protein 2 [Pyrinomonas methylaliphatogenes]
MNPLLLFIPERWPAILSLIYAGGLAFVALLLLLALARRTKRTRDPLTAIAPEDLPDEVRKRLSATATNRSVYAFRLAFVSLMLTVFGFHIYWALYAAEKDEKFQALSYKDLRNRRLAESTLRGWILDRTGQLERALALYRRDERGQIVREYPLDQATVHLLGTDRGDPGLERALFGVESGALPEAIDVALERNLRQPATLDVRLTIDRELQKAVVEQLRGRHGAVVILNPQTGEVLAMYSNPSYSVKDAQDEATWIRLDADKRDSPLVNRALSFYYIPGSTFKTIIMLAAYRAGMQDAEFVCSSNGYYAQPGARPIYDDGGPAEVHGRLNLARAYEVSCNQYFAQLAVKLGPQRIREAARALGIGVYDNPDDALRGRKQPEIWNASSSAIARALAPREATIVAADRMRPYDLALIGFGQGYAGQMTPFAMALAASAIANLEGKLMKPKIELDRPPETFAQVVAPQQAAEMRAIMGRVTMGAEGTARRVFAALTAAGITTGGKTGTAQKDVPVYDPKTGEPVTVKKYERDRTGRIIREYEQVLISPEKRIDSWFLCIAPLERPQIAMAVIVEGGGYGARAAAPVAAALVAKARDLGLLGPLPQSDAQSGANRRARSGKRAAAR